MRRSRRGRWLIGSLVLGIAFAAAAPAVAQPMTWSISPSPTPDSSIYSELWDVSCASSTFCAAVGDYGTGAGGASGGNSHTLAEVWNGHVWTVAPTPSGSSNPQRSLSAVSCTSSSFCMAVGADAGTHQPIATAWNGRAWTFNPTAACAGQRDK